MKGRYLLGVGLAFIVVAFLLTRVIENQYLYFAGYLVLQYVILATAWNILGGFTGYVNFGSGAFFGAGAYTAAVLIKFYKANLLTILVSGGLVAAVLGLAIGYLTLRVRGVYFAISTLALSVVVMTIILNTPALGGANGLYIFRPKEIPVFANYIELLFVVMVALCVVAVAFAWLIQHSWVGRSLVAIRDDEEAAACAGVPVLRLKVFATTISGMLMGVAGAPYPYFVTYLEPVNTISLDVGVNSLAMPLIGGTGTWLGPVVGALLLGVTQQITTVTLSAEYNLLVVGVLLVGFVVFAPDGVVGLGAKLLQRKSA